jgi:hypothetical protein
MSKWDKVKDQEAWDQIIPDAMARLEPEIDRAVQRFLDGFERDYRRAIQKRHAIEQTAEKS